MNKLAIRICRYLLSAMLLVGLQVSKAESSSGFLWEVSNDQQRVYLLGSIHFANASFYPLRDEINTAFAQADSLAVEVDIGALDPAAMQQMLLHKGAYQDGTTIKDHISAETYRLLTQYLERHGLPVELFDRYKPGMLVMTLSSMELMRLGLSPTQGIDNHFLNRARGVKPIETLETLEQQLDLMIDNDHGEQQLRQTLEEFANYPELLEKLTTIWQQGDTEQLAELLIHKPLRDYPQSRPIFEKLFIQRNHQMTEKIMAYLASGNTYFVVVGAGHMVGEEGIIELLRGAGFSVQRR